MLYFICYSVSIYLVCLFLGHYSIKYAVSKKWMEEIEDKSFSSFEYIFSCAILGMSVLFCLMIALLIFLNFLLFLIS